MTPEQMTILDYYKMNVSAEICIDTLLTSLSVSHPTLHDILTLECIEAYVENGVIIAAIAEVLHYQDTAPSGVCPKCGSTGYDASHTNLAECNKCGTFFKLNKRN